MSSDIRSQLAPGVSVDELLADYRTACISRAIDDREVILQKQGQVFFQIAGAGMECLHVALARSIRPGHDWIFGYYRDRALALAVGMTPDDMLLASVGAGTDPISGGRQMPSHFSMPERHLFSVASPIAVQCLPAIGCAEAGRYITRHRDELSGLESHDDEITVVTIGDGGTSEGEFWESLNTACTLRLPVLYVVADNGWAISVPVAQQQSAPISQLVSGFAGLTVRTVDGCDYVAVRAAAAELTALLRKGEGPALLHASVTRPYSHSAQDTQSKYRTAADLAAEAARDPLVAMARVLTDCGLDVSSMPEDARQVVSLAAKRALAAPRPDPATVADQLVDQLVETSREVDEAVPTRVATGPTMTMADTINKVLHERMSADARIRVFGEDVADAPEHVMGEVPGKGGVFGITYGLQRTFGPDRCYNTPLAEANIVGRALGQAARGLHPVAEVQFFDYIWPAMQQLRSAVGTLRWRTNGRFRAPMVVRVPIGGYLRGGAIWHSQSGESIFAHCPGLLIAFPSRASDAAGLLRTALDSDDPVLFLEHKHLYRQPYASDPYRDAPFSIPFGRGRIVRHGDDATVVTWGATVQRCMEAAERLAADGVELEIIDLRTIVPWDHDIVAASVQRTNRLLVVHEDTLSGGFGGEIAAWAAQELFCDLDAPVMRVGALDVPVPYEPTLEDAVLPQVDGITEVMWKLVEF